jgi:hypothetical protein
MGPGVKSFIRNAPVLSEKRRGAAGMKKTAKNAYLLVVSGLIPRGSAAVQNSKAVLRLVLKQIH